MHALVHASTPPPPPSTPPSALPTLLTTTAPSFNPIIVNSARPTPPRAPTLKCTQCKKNRPVSDFPLRNVSLAPFSICKNHVWYWTEERRSAWAPKDATSLDALCDNVMRSLDGESVPETWVLEGEEVLRSKIVERVAKVGGWNVKAIPVRKTRAKSGQSVPAAHHFDLSPPSNASSTLPSFRLSLTHQAALAKFAVVLKIPPAPNGKSWRKDTGMGRTRDLAAKLNKAAAQSRSRADQQQPQTVEVVTKGKGGKGKAKGKAKAVEVNEAGDLIVGTLDAEESEGPRTPSKSRRWKRQLVGSDDESGGARGPPPRPARSSPSNIFHHMERPLQPFKPPEKEFRRPKRAKITTVPFTAPSPSYAPSASTATASTSVSMVAPSITLHKSTSPRSDPPPLTLFDLLKSPFLGSPPLPEKKKKSRLSIVDTAASTSNEEDSEEEESEEEEEFESEEEEEEDDGFDSEDLLPEEDDEEEDDEESDEEDDGDDDGWLDDFVKNQLDGIEEGAEAGGEV
ncbi:hypothetical protein MNV49_002901 [Pseudohyphozyma bogoriensis]|nr:hypothetical protein MNV49_002901 [Pseudohyphozyma bogoriensis]